MCKIRVLNVGSMKFYSIWKYLQCNSVHVSWYLLFINYHNIMSATIIPKYNVGELNIFSVVFYFTFFTTEGNYYSQVQFYLMILQKITNSIYRKQYYIAVLINFTIIVFLLLFFFFQGGRDLVWRGTMKMQYCTLRIN